MRKTELLKSGLSETGLFRSVSTVRRISGRSSIAVTVGNFDGMHLGHRALFEEVKKLEAEKNILVTFSPHPRFFFKRLRGDLPSRDERLLTPIRRKFQLARELGFDSVLVIRFDKELAALEPEEFVERNLLGLGEVKGIVVGEDWCFGKNRSGNALLLKQIVESRGIQLRVICDQSALGERVSSSRIRRLLSKGEVKDANALLGSPYGLSGKVFRGDQRGRQIGFPTANINPKDALTPQAGVYVTTTEVDGVAYRSITNVGVRPTFDGDELRVETHILNGFQSEIYTERINVYFHERIREELKFSTVSELKAQIERDIRAREAFSI
jgi:riboflavin kinase / FMN adenylyltransferase